jgi:hypothetical protein
VYATCYGCKQLNIIAVVIVRNIRNGELNAQENCKYGK